MFVSTHIDDILCNLALQQLFLSGGLTDQSVEGAIGEDRELGYLLPQATDA